MRTRKYALASLVAALALAGAFSPGVSRAGHPPPDLTASVEDVYVERDTNVTLGDVAEGCASATTGIDLLRFSTLTHNEGLGDFEIGDPLCPDCDESPGAICGNPSFHCSEAGGHGHGHYTNYAIYELLDASEAVVAEGGKLGFCLIDSFCDVGLPRFASCDFQGLSAGCSDLYDVSLGCQYIEVTGLPDGEYTLRITVDPGGEIDESDESNNAALFRVTLGDGSTEPDEELEGASLQLATRSAGGTKLRLVARPDGAFALPGPGHEPTDGGATLEVSDAATQGGALSLSLPAAGWERLDRSARTAGYRFRGSKHDACKSARLDGDGLRARCQGTGLALPVSGALDVVFTSAAGKRYCARFGGTEKRNDARRLRRVDAASAACPAPAP